MKKQLQLIFSLMILTCALHAQVQFSDDFESYNAGDLLGASSDVWVTWGGPGGGGDDAAVVNDNANSGTNALRLTAVGAGGPSDMVLPFGDRYTSGNLHLDFMINVVEGASAYYNFQGDVTPGTQWVYNVFMTPDGVINFAGGGNTTVMAATHTPGAWTKMGIDVDLTNNVWAFSVNDECVGSFQNPSNNLASLNLYPTAGDDFYIDDVNMSYSPDGAEYVTDAMISLDRSLPVGVLNGSTSISGVVSNIGSTTIEGFEIVYNGDAEAFSEAIEPGGEYAFVLAATHSVSEGASEGTVTLRGINDDENSCNNVSTLVSRSIEVPRGKLYVAEEATGTWCTWCPRGDVFMNYMNDTYPELFIGIAVHNSDPMANDEYDAAFTSQSGFSGFPSVWTERSSYLDPSGLENDFITKVQEPSPVEISLEATYDEMTRELVVSADVEALSTVLPTAGLILLLTEDGVTGTGAGYNQVNAYAGGAQGEMGGYENLPNPVPASMMVYNHVARALLNGFEGEEYGDVLQIGNTTTFTSSVTLPEEWEADNIHIVAIHRNTDGTTPTGKKSTIAEAEVDPVSSTIVPVLAKNVEIFPNPFAESANVTLTLDTPTNVSIEITDALGRLVSSRDYGVQAGNLTFPVLANQMNDGIYFINILAGDSFTSKRIVVRK
jgi:hypothetical protein